MELQRWLPIYRKIIADLGYDEDEDRRAGDVLARLVKGHKALDLDSLGASLAGRATVVAKGPELARDLKSLTLERPLISAGSATSHLVYAGIIPDMIVSDLDGKVASEITASANGVPCFIHAHGDNIPTLEKWVGRYRGPVIPTMQTEPVPGVFNFGGFTDGDRAVEIARHFGAREIELIGFDFDWREDESVERAKKIGWARHIVCDLNPRDVVIRGARGGKP
jgi:uncharacterized Rossmann fold enzyme